MPETSIAATSPFTAKVDGYQAVILALIVMVAVNLFFPALTSYYSEKTRFGTPIAQDFLAYLDDPKRQFHAGALDWLPFVPVSGITRNIGYSNSAHWLRIDLRATEGVEPKRYLSIASPDTTEVSLVAPIPTQDRVLHSQLGAKTPAAMRPTQYPASVFDLAWVPEEAPYVYVRVSSHNSIYLRPWLYTETEMEQHVRKIQLEVGFISGCFFIMVLMCLLLYRHSKESPFLWLTVCTSLLLLIELSNKEYAFMYLWSSFPNWAPAATATLMAGFLAAYSMFVASTSSLRQVAPTLRWACIVLAGSTAATALVCLLGIRGLRWAIPVLHLQYAVAAVLFPAVSLVACHRGVSGALRYPALHGLFSLVIVWRLVESYGGDVPANPFVPMHASDLFTLSCIATCVFLANALSQFLSKHQLTLWQVRRNALQNLETQVLTRTLELETARRQSETTAKTQRRLLATLTHEMRTPLSAIIGISGLLREDRRFVPALRSDLATVERLSRQLLHIVDQSLAQVRAERDAPVAQEDVMMHTFVHDIETICSWMSDSHTSSFAVQCDGPVPDILRFDERAVKQIYINLITNAGRYCDQGSIQVKLSFQRTSPGSGTFVTTISDTGRGMHPSRMKMLFEPFQPSRHKAGIGMGLSIVRDLVDSCAGQIHVASRLNRGTTFTVSIPTEIIPVPHPTQQETSDTLPAPLFEGDVSMIDSEFANAAEPPLVSAAQVALTVQWLPDLYALCVLAQQGAYSKMEQWLDAARSRVPADNQDVQHVLQVLEEQIEQLDYQALAATIALGTHGAQAPDSPHAPDGHLTLPQRPAHAWPE